MATLMTSPDESRLAIVDLTEQEYLAIKRSLEAALGQGGGSSCPLNEHAAIAAVLKALND